MPASIVNHTAASDGSAPGSAVFNLTVPSTGAGNLLILVGLLFQSGNSHVNSVSDGVSGFTHFPSAEFVTSAGALAGITMDVWYLSSSNSGRTTITVTANQATQFKSFDLYEISGFSTPATDGVVGDDSKTGVGTTFTGETLTTTATGFIIGLCVEANATQNPKSGNVFTSGGDIVGTDAWCSYISPSAGSYTPEWLSSISGGTFCTLTVGFKEGAAGGDLNALIGEPINGYSLLN